MTAAPELLAERRTPRRDGVTAARALASTTRAEIFEHVQAAGGAVSVREIAAAFDLHPNVARSHLETLADAQLVVVGRRKHARGGRPAKVYTAHDDVPLAPTAPDAAAGAAAEASALAVAMLVTLLDAPPAASAAAALARAHEVAAREGRRLVQALPGRDAGSSPGAVGAAACRALRSIAPGAAVVGDGDDWVDIAGARSILCAVEAVKPDLADVFERGLLSGALAAGGLNATLSDAGTTAEGAVVVRARRNQAPTAPLAAPSGTIDARGLTREGGVVRAVQAIGAVAVGEVLEILAEGAGAPAAFARWADRSGHHLLGVERVADAGGRPAIRILLRRGR